MEKKILIKRVLFLIFIIAIASGCIFVMNIHYDRLSRYPYQDENDRALINQYLNDSEIEYIIEYSIAPVTFVKYLGCNGFNIYHISEYNQLSDYLGYGTACDMVSKVELTRDKVDVPTLAELSRNYASDVIDFWFMYNDIYNPNSILVSNPHATDVIVNDTYTISKTIPIDLVSLDQSIPSSSDDIKVSSRILIPLSEMCNALEEEFGQACGGLEVEVGYMSYDDQVQYYTAMQSTYGSQTVLYADYPGHSEHQLGLAIDLVMQDESPIEESEQYQWLLVHSQEYGFVQTYGENNSENKPVRPRHFRFNGNRIEPVVVEEPSTEDSLEEVSE